MIVTGNRRSGKTYELIKEASLTNSTILCLTEDNIREVEYIACKNLNRRFIGCELDEKYFEMAVERLKGEE